MNTSPSFPPPGIVGWWHKRAGRVGDGVHTVHTNQYVPWVVHCVPIKERNTITKIVRVSIALALAHYSGKDARATMPDLTPQQALDLARELVEAAGLAAQQESNT